MGLFFNKKTRRLLDRRKVVASYTVLGICILLIAVNIGGFIFFPMLMAPLAILISNAITLILAIIAFRPVNSLVENLLQNRQEELLARQKKEEALEQQLDLLENKNRELEDRLDTRSQTEGAPYDIEFTFKLEQMEYAKKGYVVKEENLETLGIDQRFKHMIPDVGLFNKMLDVLMMKGHGTRKILYIKKYYYKVSIGIDFSKIKFSFEGDRILLSGVKFSKLHDISSEMESDPGDIDHCWIINSTDNWAEIKHSAYYDMFKDAYTRMQEAETHDSLESEVDTICRRYTEIFRKNIQSRFPQVQFTDSIDDSELSWYALKEGGTYRLIREIASNMLLLTNVINETKQIEEQLAL